MRNVALVTFLFVAAFTAIGFSRATPPKREEIIGPWSSNTTTPFFRAEFKADGTISLVLFDEIGTTNLYTSRWELDGFKLTVKELQPLTPTSRPYYIKKINFSRPRLELVYGIRTLRTWRSEATLFPETQILERIAAAKNAMAQ